MTLHFVNLHGSRVIYNFGLKLTPVYMAGLRPCTPAGGLVSPSREKTCDVRVSLDKDHVTLNKTHGVPHLLRCDRGGRGDNHVMRPRVSRHVYIVVA